jgi:hypothetical protein
VVSVRKRNFLLYILGMIASAATIGSGATPVAAQNHAPPSGAILDLSGLAVSGNPERHFVTFTALVSNPNTAISFAFRDDPGFLQFSNVSLVDVAAPDVNLLSNGDFSQDPGAPLGWNYYNINDVALGGSVSQSCVGPGSCWSDGAVQGYDELSQSVTTTAGHEYLLAFYATNLGGPDVWSAVSTNGKPDSNGNGGDILAYVGGIDGPYPHLPPATAPELSTWAMMMVGFLGLGGAGYRRATRRATTTSVHA